MNNDRGSPQINWFFSVLFLLFLTLKLTHIISWSWWWVSSPLWGPVLLLILFILIIGIITIIRDWMDSRA